MTKENKTWEDRFWEIFTKNFPGQHADKFEPILGLVQKEIQKAVEGEKKKWVCQKCLKYPPSMCPFCAELK